MLYPFTIDTDITVSYIQNNRYEDEKKPSPNVYTLNPRMWFMLEESNMDDINDPLIVNKLNNIIKVYYGMMIERIKGYVKPEDKNSVFIRRLDEKSVEFVVNDRLNEGDGDNGLLTYNDICNHFNLLLEVLRRHDELKVVKCWDITNPAPPDLSNENTISRIIDKHICDTYGVVYNFQNGQLDTTVSYSVHDNLISDVKNYQTHFVGGLGTFKYDTVCYYYADRVPGPVKVNNTEYSRGTLIRNHVDTDDIIDSLYPHTQRHFINKVVTHVSEIIVDKVTFPDGGSVDTKVAGLPNRFNYYSVFEHWNYSEVVITKFIEKVMKECTVSTVATDCETLYPDEPFTLKPDTLYSFNVNEQVLRVIEHELLRLNLPYVFIRRADDTDDLQWLIISDGIERHLSYLKRYIELTGIESGVFLNSHIQVNDLHQGSLENETQVLGKGILVNDADTAVNLSHLLYGILKGVYV